MKRMRVPRAFRRVFLTYLIVVLLPLVALTFFFYTNLISRFQQLTYESQQKNCETIAMRMESSLDKLKDMAIQFGNNKDVLAYNLEGNVTSRIKVIDMLRYSLALSDIMDDVLLIDASQMVYSSSGSYQMDTYSQIFGVPLQEICEIAQQNTVTRTMNVIFVDAKHVYFACNYPFNAPYPAGTLIFKISKELLLRDVSFASYALYYDDQMIVTTDSTLAQMTQQDVAVNMNDDYHIFHAASGRVRITALIDQRITFNSFYRTRSQMLVLEIVLVLFCLLLISYFSYKNYQPLSRLNNTLSQLGMKERRSDVDRDAEIADSIHFMQVLFQQNRQLGRSIENEKQLTCELLLFKLLENRFGNLEQLRKSLSIYGVRLNSPEYAVVILKCNQPLERQDYTQLIAEYKDMRRQELCFCCGLNDRLVVLIGGASLSHGVLEGLSKELIQRLNSFHVLAEAYIGPQSNELERVNFSYTKTMSMLDYQQVNNGILHFYTSLPLEERKTYYPQAELNSLLRAINEQQLPTIGLLMQTIIGQIGNELCDFSFAKTIAYATINTLIKSANADDLNDVKRIRTYLLRLEAINCKADVVAMMTEMRQELTNGGDEESIEHATDEAENRLNMILQYIDEHYDDPQLFIGSISEKYGLASNNLSQQFKRRFGINPSKYLTSLRIERAKKLLRESEYSIQQISQLSGFSDFSSFNRNFKLTVSLSPSQYRRVNRKGMQD